MLPTTGYFKDIECPFFENICDRPYCHFRHNKKKNDLSETSKQEPMQTPDVPTYNPTPKSQLLANTKTHIPIRYVPDLAVSTERSSRKPQSYQPTYQPTPLSVLSNVNKYNALSETKYMDISDSFQKIIDFPNTQYNPSEPLNDDDNINFEELSTEFDMIDEIISDTVLENEVTIETKTETQDPEELFSIKNNKTISKHDIKNSEEKSLKSESKSTIRDNKVKSKHSDKDGSGRQKNEMKRDKYSDFKHKDREKSKDKSSNGEKHQKKDENHKAKEEKHRKEKDNKHKTSKSSNKGSRQKSDSDSSEDAEKRKIQKGKEGNKEKSHKSTKSGRSKSWIRSSEKSDSEFSNKQTSDSEERKPSKSSSNKYKNRDRDKNKKCSSAKDAKKETSDREQKTKSKIKVDSESNKHLKRDHNKHTSDGKSNKEKEVVVKQKKDSKGQQKSAREISDESEGDDKDHHNFEMSDDDNFADDYFEDDTLEECYRIFNEYKPEQPEIERKPIINTEEVNIEITNFGKKRVAHNNAEQHIQKLPHVPPKPVANAAQVMTNRFKIARMTQASNEQYNLVEEIRNHTLKRPPPSSPVSVVPNKYQKLFLPKKKPTTSKAAIDNIKKSIIQNSQKSASLIDDILSSKPSKPLRIAPVQNVNSIQRAKERITEIAKQNAVNALRKTSQQSLPKGSKRVAHVPEFTLSDIPDVLEANKSKLPVNVRTRYLTMLADECFKLYLSKDDAYQRALNEEYKCYERCKVLVTYRNSAMLSINRLRKEVQEREKQGLGPLGFGETTQQTESSQFKGRRFYENIKEYVLTEEDLIQNGYPRESSVHGRAVVKTQKQVSTLPLEENERICCRCMKLYLVNDDGFPLYSEDCIYHPLKKRTLRGERTYLCCKSSDDVGCATSHTHVSETNTASELDGFQTTMESEYDDDPRNYAVYALDCEMCYTTKGLELTRVTIVDIDCKTVYESLVKPLNSIIDYNTRFSGITKEQMDRTSTSILQVQANILHLCNSRTILIGHSLESDMKALKIVHSNIIDTAIMFPHKMGLPHKRALRTLASEYLKKIIQNDVCGHDSAEDALTCMELVRWKVKEELKVRGARL